MVCLAGCTAMVIAISMMPLASWCCGSMWPHCAMDPNVQSLYSDSRAVLFLASTPGMLHALFALLFLHRVVRMSHNGLKAAWAFLQWLRRSMHKPNSGAETKRSNLGAEQR